MGEVTIFKEKDIFKGVHSFVCGMTQSGKTYFTIHELQKTRQPVLFFNPQNETVKGFIKATRLDNIDLIVKALKNGGKINYIPEFMGENADFVASCEFCMLVETLFGQFQKSKPIVFAIDEVHMLSNRKESKIALKRVANRGLTWGLNAVFISQRPADVPYTIYTQCDKQYIFFTGMEKEYFRRKGIDYEDLKHRIGNQKEAYNFCVYDNVNLEGAYRI